MQRILRGAAATLRTYKLDEQGEIVAPAGIPSVSAVRSDGTAVTVGAVTVSGTEITAPLAATQTTLLDVLTVTWTDTDGSTWTTTVEIVGGFFFSIKEARDSDPTLENTTKYPNADILAVRTEVEQEFEEICQQAFVPRFAKEVHTSRGAVILEYPNLIKVRSVSIDSTAYTTAEIDDLTTDVAGVITGLRRGRATVSYEHGRSLPADLKRAALTRLRSRLNFDKSGIPDRATSFSVTEGGTFRLATPGANRTGLPEVDAVLERYTLRTPSVA